MQMGPQPKACLIDNTGRVWDTRSRQLRDQFGLEDAIGDIATLLVKTAGCIRIDAVKRAVHISFNPKTVSPVAIGGLMYYLHDQRLHRHPNVVFCLSILEGEASTARVVEVYASIKQAANRLQFLSEEHRHSDQKRFQAHRLSLKFAERSFGLSRVLEAWRAQAAVYETNIIKPILSGDLNNRYCLIGQSHRGCGFTFLEMGSGYRIPFPDYDKRVIGKDLNAIPDTLYAEWLSETYSEVMQKGEPRLEEIAVHIFFPDTGLIARRYRRLLLPWLDKAGRRLLLSVNSGM